MSARPLRFCLLTTFYPPAGFGGDAIQVQRLARALAARGHEVTVVHSREAYRALAPGRPATVPPDEGIRIVPVDARAGALSPLATYLTGRPLLARGTLRKALDADYDVVHFHNPSLLGGPALLGMGSGLKLYTAHEQWLLCPTHVLWKYGREVCEQPRCWACTLSYRRPPQPWRLTPLLERSLAALDALIVPSRTSERLHERFAGIVRIERIPHFVPDGRDDDEAAFPHERPFFLFAGRLEPIKGAQTLIAAFRRRRSEDLVVAGAGSLEGSLRRLAADLPHVRFLGQVDPSAVGSLYRRALAVVVPTLGHESFGLVPVEAFARGTPALVHRFGALAELVEESGGGIAYEGDAELDGALARLAEEPELRRELGERGRAAYLAHWTEQAHLERYFGLVAELARARGNAELAALAEAEAAGRPSA